MQRYTETAFTAENLATLEELIQLNTDSATGFDNAAELVDNAGLADFMRRIASERREQARQLQAIVATQGGEPRQGGSMTAAAHRMWTNLRSSMGGGAHAVLSEAESGEDHMVARYELALAGMNGTTVGALLQQHRAAVRDAHDRIKQLRDAYNA
jgi:uncharacterized protein (TIGR02284 family)